MTFCKIKVKESVGNRITECTFEDAFKFGTEGTLSRICKSKCTYFVHINLKFWKVSRGKISTDQS